MHKVPHAALRIPILALALTGLAVRALGQEMTISVPIQPNYNYNPAISTMYFLGSQARFAPLMQFQSAAPIGPVAHTVGTGLSDLTSGGTGSFAGLTALVSHVFQIKLCAAGAPDTFDFGVDAPATCGVPTAIVAGLANPLANGVTVTFKAATGHAAGDQWQINAFAPHQEEWLNLGSGWNGSSWNTPGTPQCWADLNGQLQCVGGILNPITLQTNTVNNFSQSLLNLISGTGISIVNTSGGNVQINSTATASCGNLNLVTDLWIDTAGSDSTGDGSNGNPWKTIQHAFDAGVPGIVCGRYIIHLKTAGTYVGGGILAGRIFAGGGTAFPNPPDQFWPYSQSAAGGVTDNTWPYSWVEILGSTAAPETYIIQNATSCTAASGTGLLLSHAYLDLRGVEVSCWGFGVNATNDSILNLAGVIGTNNFTSFLITTQSMMHIDASGFVDNNGTDSIKITNTTVGGVNFTGVDGIELADHSYLTDTQTDGNNTNPGTQITYAKGSGGLSLFCIELKNSYVYLRGALSCQFTGLGAHDGDFILASYAFDGQSAPFSGQGNSQCARLDHSVLSGQTLGGGVYTCSNAARGIALSAGSLVDTGPSMTSVTTPYLDIADDGTPANPTSISTKHSFISYGFIAQAITASGAFTVNADNGGLERITLTANSTLSSIGGSDDAQRILFKICQNATGGFTFAWPANVHGAGTVGAAANSCSQQAFTFDQPSATWFAEGPMVTGM